MDVVRHLLVIADDYGIGPATSRGILDLGARGVVTGAVLLVNSPFAEESVRDWRRAGQRPELGWHPCLTMDRPLLPCARVPSLVGCDGCFHSLGRFLARLYSGRISRDELRAELQAQYDRFCDLVGYPPAIVNCHKHLQVFPPITIVLLAVLREQQPLPYLRIVKEPLTMLHRVPGARTKRFLLSCLGRWAARQPIRCGYPGNDWLAGITDPPYVKDDRFFVHWVTAVPGQTVELACHPGHYDATLIGRDCSSAGDGKLQRRVDECRLLQHESFLEACARARFTRVSPSELLQRRKRDVVHAA